LAIDPGTTSGWALLRKGRLVVCGYKHRDKLLGVLFEVLERFDVQPGDLRVLWEIPRDYPGSKRKVDPNTLIRTAITGSHFAGAMHALFDAEVEEIHAQGWKGNIPKPESGSGESYRIEDLVLRVLDKSERALVYQTKSTRAKRLNYDMLDACGIGLRRVGRRIV